MEADKAADAYYGEDSYYGENEDHDSDLDLSFLDDKDKGTDRDEP